MCSVCDNQLLETGNNAGESLPPFFFFKFNILLRMSGISLMDERLTGRYYKDMLNCDQENMLEYWNSIGYSFWISIHLVPLVDLFYKYPAFGFKAEKWVTLYDLGEKLKGMSEFLLEWNFFSRYFLVNRLLSESYSWLFITINFLLKM